MGMARSLADLRALSEDELIAQHDEQARNTVVGIQYYLDELRYREQSRIAANIEQFTRYILWLTIVVVVATVVNVGFVAYTVLK